MRTTLDLDRDLLDKAKEVLGARSYTEAIERALREAVERGHARTGWDALIGSDLGWSIEDFLEYRERTRRASVP